MDDLTTQLHISVDLEVAQARLLALRKVNSVSVQTLRDESDCTTSIYLLENIPSHLGWHSHSFTRFVRKKSLQRELLPILGEYSLTSPSLKPQQPSARSVINLYPDLAMKILQDGNVSSARVWFLLRYLDKMGSGWFEENEARSFFCLENSEHRICGWRQLRKLLTCGDGIFWRRKDGKIWLRSPIKVAKHFGLVRFTLRAVELPIQVLCESIAKVRAHFYASFHSGRIRSNCSAPISRETLSTLMNLSRPTQRNYEKLAGISCQTNICISEISTPERKKQLSGEYGHALFEFTDYRGKAGKPGTTYLAWQLPNSYGGCHELSTKEHKKRLNRQLADLFGIGMTGNGKNRQVREAKRFFNDGAMASRQTNRVKNSYWRSRTQSKNVVLWHQASE